MKAAKIYIVVLGLLILIIASTALIAILHHAEHAPHLPSPPLKSLSEKHHIELGNFAIYTYLNNPIYSQILSSQYDLALIDNTPNWYFTDGGLRPTPTSYNFANMDKVVAYAQRHSMAIQAHHLLWGEDKWLPNWLKNSHHSLAQLMNIMHDHIATVVGRYKGKINEWSVVNEAFTRGQHMDGLHDWWADNTGGAAYIEQAFIWAHQADPQAKLILNDFDDEHFNTVSDDMYNYIKSAKARGIPIDGIGMQMHIDATHPPDMNEVTQNMQRFAALGVNVYVTEFDVNMSSVAAPDPVRDNIEAGIYYNMMRACIEAGDCRSFAQLGITDKETWYNYMGPSTQDARPLMFDSNYRPKAAYYAFRNALLEN